MGNPFNDPVLIQWNLTNQGEKVSVHIDNEPHQIANGRFTLVQIPDYFYKVTIKNRTMFEIKITQEITNINQYKVDYTNSIVYVSPELEGEYITVDYYGVGYAMYPASRIYDSTTNGELPDPLKTLEDYINSIKPYGYQGEYESTKAYTPNAIVSYSSEKGVYRCKKLALNILPTNTEYWECMMSVKAEVDFVNGQGDYAESQGDYAKTQGDYAKGQGDYAKSEANKIPSEVDKVVIVSDSQPNQKTTRVWIDTLKQTEDPEYMRLRTTANRVDLLDADNIFDATNVEDALKEMKTDVDSIVLENERLNEVESDISTIQTDLSNKTTAISNLNTDVNSLKNTQPVPYQPNFYIKGSREKEFGFLLPNITLSTNPVIQTDSTKITDGAKFASVIYVEGLINNPLDKFYAYVTGHDGQDIYLFTAPAPEGTWTLRQSVRNVSQSPFTGHLSSPSALVHNGKIYVYYHGNNSDGTQPTALMTSTDGINFTSSAVFPVIKVHTNKSSKFYGQSTSYASVIKYNGLFVAVFQGNSNLNNYQTVNATVTIACAVSTDGENFRVMKKPLVVNKPTQRGYFCSTITRIYDRWLLLYQDVSDGKIKASISDILEFDSFQDLGVIIDKNTATWNVTKVEAPCVLFYNNKLYIYYAGWDASNFGKIGLATVDLGVK